MKSFNLVDHFDDLDAESKYLAHKAQAATDHAYAPYSKFLVGAAVMLEDGSIITGTNQENAAYPSGMCAERVALFATAALHPEKRIMKMAIVARKKGVKQLTPATSCGPCRQVMLEFEQRQGQHFEVVMQTQDHHWLKASSAESLLPFSFSRASLEHEDKK